MFFLTKKKNPHETGCMACHAIVAILLFAATLASLLGVLVAHYDTETGAMIFGTASGSLSLLAFVVSLSFCMKSMMNCMSNCDACAMNGKKK